MKFEIGDILLVDGRVWTIIEKKRGYPLVLQSGDRKIQCYSYEIQRWITKRYKGSIHYPVVK